MNTRKAALRAGAICLKVAIFIAIVLGIVYLGQTTFHYTHAVFSDAAYEEEPGRTIKVKIPEDVSGKRLAKVLEENGLIEDANVFQIQMKIAEFGDTVKAGSYELNTSMKPSAMLQVLAGAAEE